VLKTHEGLGRPQLPPKLLSGHELAGPLDKHRQHLEGLRLKTQAYPGLPQLAHTPVQLEHAEANNLERRSSEVHPFGGGIIAVRLVRCPPNRWPEAAAPVGEEHSNQLFRGQVGTTGRTPVLAAALRGRTLVLRARDGSRVPLFIRDTDRAG
jgi:hypothetical protein